MMRNPEHRINQISDFENPAVDAILSLMAVKRLSFAGSPAPTGVGEKIYSANGVEEK
ncbi:MAG: hypothetical protein ABI891_04395 [Acidobacteriota bacterium]